MRSSTPRASSRSRSPRMPSRARCAPCWMRAPTATTPGRCCQPRAWHQQERSPEPRLDRSGGPEEEHQGHDSPATPLGNTFRSAVGKGVEQDVLTLDPAKLAKGMSENLTAGRELTPHQRSEEHTSELQSQF